MKFSQVAGGLVLAVLISSRALEAQTCRAASDSATTLLLRWVGNRTNPTNAKEEAYRVAMGYPLVARAQLSLVTQTATCSKALTAYHAAGAGGTGFTGRVAVIKAGTTYTVFDPGYYYGPPPRKGSLFVLLDSTYKVIKKFGV